MSHATAPALAGGHGAAHDEHSGVHRSIAPFIAAWGTFFFGLGLVLWTSAYSNNTLASTDLSYALPGQVFIGLGGFVLITALVVWFWQDMTISWDPSPEMFIGPFRHLPVRKFGLWIFLMSEMMIFSTLFSTYFKYRISDPDWISAASLLDWRLGAVNTFALLLSSFTLVMAHHSIRHGNRRGLVFGLMGTFFLGALFLCIKAFEWYELIHNHDPYVPWASVSATTFYTATGTHGAHVFAGLVGLLFLAYKGHKGGFTPKNNGAIEYFGIYWHFVDLVWVFLFPLFYLI